jgi:hypothetical protein
MDTRQNKGPSIWRIVIAMICGITLIMPPIAQAQGSAATVYVQGVFQASAPPGADGVSSLKLRALFTLLDGTGLPVAEEIERVELQVGKDRYTGTFGKPSGDWAVAILLDTSATLAGSADFARMVDGLTKGLDRMPENAMYTILTFDTNVKVIQEFTRDKEAVRKLLATVKPRAGSQSCLNAGLQEAVRRVQNATTRSAVFAVTASQDNCGNVPMQAVLSDAAQRGTQIHALGVSGYAINLSNLETFTRPTFGLAYTRFANDLIFGFSAMFSGLANQQEANWTLYPPKGEQTSDFMVTLKNTQRLTGAVTFVSDQAYVPPPRIELVGVVRSLVGSIVANLNVINRARIAALKVSVVDKQTGKPVIEQTLKDFGDSLSIPANTLANEGTYSLELVALDDQNRELSRIEPSEFQYKPQVLQILINAVSAPTVNTSYFVVTITTSFKDTAGIARYKLWLEPNQSSSGLIPGTEVMLAPDDELRIPAGDLPSGKYQVKAQALDGANVVIAEAVRPFPIDYTAIGFFEKLTDRIRSSPEVVVVLLLLAVVAIIALFLLMKAARARSRVGVPVVEPGLAARPQAAGPSRVMVQPDSVPLNHGVASADLGRAPKAKALLFMREPPTNFQVAVTITPFTIGRGPGMNANLPVDPQSGVSGHHADVLLENGIWYIKDAPSRNGTFVNGKKLQPGAREQIQDRTIIGLGPKTKVEFRIQP